jgi:TRAP-type uncharacterized transport system fused permease subunit
MINEATKQANQAIPRAEGEANRVVSEAEGYATERVNLALGESARFESVLGAAFGVLLPLGILLWTLFVEHLSGPKDEATWLALNRILASGYPTAWIVSGFTESLQQSGDGALVYSLLFGTVVINWMVIGAVGGYIIGVIRRWRTSP